VWGVLGAIAQAAPGLEVGTGVSAAVHRIHPVLLAQAAETPVPTSRPGAAWAMAPSTPHTNGALPWVGVHGRRWSEIMAVRNPAWRAATAWATRADGGCSSLERK